MPTVQYLEPAAAPPRADEAALPVAGWSALI
jgi:hypothetical protein